MLTMSAHEQFYKIRSLPKPALNTETSSAQAWLRFRDDSYALGKLFLTSFGNWKKYSACGCYSPVISSVCEKSFFLLFYYCEFRQGFEMTDSVRDTMCPNYAMQDTGYKMQDEILRIRL